MTEQEEIKLKSIIKAYAIHLGTEMIINDSHSTEDSDFDNICKAISGYYKKLYTVDSKK